MNQRIQAIQSALSQVPTTTGIYFFFKEKEIIYIGKSNNLKARLTSHFENAKMDPKEDAIVGNATHIEFQLTDSDFKALLLESELIQKYKPVYNSRWRDDKSYLYIKITVKETYPKIYPVRRENDGKSLYFGPFSSNYNVESILKEIRRIFPFCMQKRLTKSPCFYAKIGYCKPCPNEIETITDEELKKKLQKEYRTNIRNVIKVLKGNTDLILKQLYQKLKELTKEEKYEEAILVRDKIVRFQNLLLNRFFVSENPSSYNLSAKSIESLKSILINFYPEMKELHRLECYDISNSAGKEATASMVVYTDGLVDKSQYRKFKIKNLTLRSDFEMLDEVLRRRFKPKNDGWPAPDLVIIDGGKPQLRFIQRVFADMQITIPFIGIAKHPDRLIIGTNLTTVKPKLNNLGFNLVRSIRDESHRFAKKYHVYLRDKKLMV